MFDQTTAISIGSTIIGYFILSTGISIRSKELTLLESQGDIKKQQELHQLSRRIFYIIIFLFTNFVVWRSAPEPSIDKKLAVEVFSIIVSGGLLAFLWLANSYSNFNPERSWVDKKMISVLKCEGVDEASVVVVSRLVATSVGIIAFFHGIAALVGGIT